MAELFRRLVTSPGYTKHRQQILDGVEVLPGGVAEDNDIVSVPGGGGAGFANESAVAEGN